VRPDRGVLTGGELPEGPIVRFCMIRIGMIGDRRRRDADGPDRGRGRDQRVPVKQVMPIVAEEYEIFVVVTVYVYFIGGVK